MIVIARRRIAYIQFQGMTIEDLHTCISAHEEKKKTNLLISNLCTSLAEHVKTVVRSNVPMAVFNKLRKIRGMCLRVEIMIFFLQGRNFIKLVQQCVL